MFILSANILERELADTEAHTYPSGKAQQVPPFHMRMNFCICELMRDLTFRKIQFPLNLCLQFYNISMEVDTA